MAAIIAYASSALRASSSAALRSRPTWNVGKHIKIVTSPALTLAGWGCMVTAAFQWSTIAGFVIAGIAFWSIEWGVRE